MRATCDELLLKRQFNYEKNDHCHFCVFAAGFDAGVLLERTRDEYDHNASDYCNGACAGASHHHNNNDASDRRRLLSGSRHRFKVGRLTRVFPLSLSGPKRLGCCTRVAVSGALSAFLPPHARALKQDQRYDFSTESSAVCASSSA